jgi:hypothetical protein
MEINQFMRSCGGGKKLNSITNFQKCHVYGNTSPLEALFDFAYIYGEAERNCWKGYLDQRKQLTLQCRVLLENLRGAQPVRNFPVL